MKTMIVTLVCLMMVVMAQAYEIRENPDRKISFGLNYDRSWDSSEWKFGAFKISDFTKVTSNQVIADMKIPLSSILTFQLRGGYLNSDNDIFTGENVKSSGYDIGFGIRFYLQ